MTSVESVRAGGKSKPFSGPLSWAQRQRLHSAFAVIAGGCVALVSCHWALSDAGFTSGRVGSDYQRFRAAALVKRASMGKAGRADYSQGRLRSAMEPGEIGSSGLEADQTVERLAPGKLAEWIEELAQRDAAQALSYALGIPDSDLRQDLLQAVLRGWARVAITEAGQWARSQTFIPEGLALAAVFNGAEERPVEMVRFVRELSDAEPHRAGEYGGYAIFALGQGGKHEVAAAIAVGGNAELATHWLSAAFNSWGREEPEDSVLSALAISDPKKKLTALRAAISGWAHADPGRLVEYASGFPEGPEKTFALIQGLRIWTEVAPGDAAHWIAHCGRWIPGLETILDD